MPFVILPTNSASGGYDITNSLRFNSGSSDYITRTPASASNREKWTLSLWVKRTNLSANDMLFYAHGGGSLVNIAFNGTHTLYMDIGGIGRMFETNAVFRDVSAWYHFVIAFNTTDYSTVSAGQVKVYVNGVEQTFSSTTNMSLGYDSAVNNTTDHTFGRDEGANNNYANFYLSEIFLIDGQQLTPTSFGETDENTGIWKPKAYTGTYGTNGFYLQFKNSASLGTDSSGNGNTFTVNNLTSIDQTTDTPTNNFATMNALSNTGITMTQGNLKGDGTGDQNFRSTFAVNKGKWYWEVKLGANGGVWGICNENVTQATDRSGIAGVYGIQNAGTTYAYKRDNGTTAESAGFPNPVSGNIMNMAFDADNAKLYIGINGTYYNLSGTTGNPATSSNPTYSSIDTTLLWLAFCEFRGASQSCELNFGNPLYSSGSYTDGAGYGNFSYQVPAGFYSLNTKNLSLYG